MNDHSRKENDRHDLTDKDFYTQACSYFYYHAEQRTTMINFFIAVFAAAIALYGSLIKDYTLASMLIAVFLLVVSVLFFMIDLRNRFDVKESQSVICQFERDYGIDTPRGQRAYGVFSNEDNVFKYYGFRARKKLDAPYRELTKDYKKARRGKLSAEELARRIDAMAESDPKASREAIAQSLGKRPIVTLSYSIKMLYIVCMVISVLAFVLALLILLGAI